MTSEIELAWLQLIGPSGRRWSRRFLVTVGSHGIRTEEDEFGAVKSANIDPRNVVLVP
jgi:hypothetical protein